jgi:AcrR family transcriptional regulator
MTKNVKLVIVSYETLQSAQDVLVAMVGDIDPASPRGKTRRRLLDAAAELFVTQGYRKTSIDEIARRAGIGKGTVYLHFTDQGRPAGRRGRPREAAVARARRRRVRRRRVRPRPPARLGPRRPADGRHLAAHRPPRRRRRGAVRRPRRPRPRPAQPEARHRDELLGKLLDEAAGPPGLTAEQRRERIVVLESLTRLAPRLRSPELHQGLGVERFADVLAGIIADGLAGHSPNGAR